MDNLHLLQQAERYLHTLCDPHPHRRVGSRGNQAATEFLAKALASFDFRTTCPVFECIDWVHGDVQLMVAGRSFPALISPYSLGCDLQAKLYSAATIAELKAVEAEGNILLLHGDLTKEQLMPKKFPFYNPARHQEIIGLLEAKQPAALITATGRDPGLAGGVYPFPLIEDGDFDIPSVYMTDLMGAELAQLVGQEATLKSEARRIPTTGCNVIARKGQDRSGRIVLCAHIDSKEGTPGALDNATGIVVLLLAAELLKHYAGPPELELVAFNGEDYYAASGEILYVSDNQDKWDEIVLAVNMDLAGYRQAKTAYSLYDCPPEIEGAVVSAFAGQQETVLGERWYQSDHSVFIQNGRPAVAVASEPIMELSTHVTHTAQDQPELVDCSKLVAIALALRDMVVTIQRMALGSK